MIEQERLDYIKANVSVSAFIESIGGEFSRKGPRNWDRYHCPFPQGHVNGDAHASGAVTVDDQMYICAACNVRGDIFSLVVFAGLAKDFLGAVAWLESNAIPEPSTTDSW
jgi:hypothetical protein